MKISGESWVLVMLGLADLMTTIVFIKMHGAQEANPIFHQYWQMGLVAFIVAKMVCLLGPITILEWARTRNPELVRFALRTAIFGYVLLYGIGFFRLNNNNANADQKMTETSYINLSNMKLKYRKSLFIHSLNYHKTIGKSLSWNSVFSTVLDYHMGLLNKHPQYTRIPASAQQ